MNVLTKIRAFRDQTAWETVAKPMETTVWHGLDAVLTESGSDFGPPMPGENSDF